jgi:hypothetical protein
MTPTLCIASRPPQRRGTFAQYKKLAIAFACAFRNTKYGGFVSLEHGSCDSSAGAAVARAFRSTRRNKR